MVSDDQGETKMLHSTRRRAAAVLAAATLLAAGCTGEDGASPETTTGAISVGTGDRYSATIRRDSAGVPHITADDHESLAFGQGWASGQDRPCDLADQVIKVRGERARWFGPGDDDANIESDLAWRNIGIAERAQDDWEDASEEVRSLITAYTDGWNGHLETVGPDGIGDWCQGAEWLQPLDPADVYTYARSIALQASGGQLARFMGTAQPPGAREESTDDTAGTGGPDATGSTGDPDGSEGSDGTDSTDGPDSPDAGDPDEGGDTEATIEAAFGELAPPLASNAWAIGSERSESGGGMLVANPHFPWEGELRFWEVHLTVPGQTDVYGVQLSGLPGIGIGFTDQFAWTHTVSAGSRFTAYRLDLVPGDPTSYRYGDEQREMTSEDVTIDVLSEDGELTQHTRTVWSSHYGPIIDFPGFGWSDAATITYRDANIDNDEFIEQYVQMLHAETLDDMIELQRTYTGVPLFNTVATSADGRAWYGDTAATPNLSDEAVAAYERSLAEDPIVAIAAESRAVLLDGSDPLFEWQEVEGARDPGLVPFDEMPVVERSDYVFNANDSFWMPHATELLEGDYSILHGRQRVPQSPRTRENATVLEEAGTFDLDSLADASLANRGFMARALLDEVVERCTDAGPVPLDDIEWTTEDAPDEVPDEVDVTEACQVLSEWDGVYDLDSVGPPIWREMMAGFDWLALTEVGPLWLDPFDPADPLGTPSGLAPPLDGGRDPVLANLARAVVLLDAAGIDLRAPLGEVQFAERNGNVIPIHGGEAVDGVPNVVSWATAHSTLDPELADQERTTFAIGSSLAKLGGTTGYPVSYGTSFLLALEYGPEGPKGKAFLTYGNPSDRSSPLYTAATEDFSAKAWRDVNFTEEAVAADTRSTLTVRG